jgi:hypothetical protein
MPTSANTATLPITAPAMRPGDGADEPVLLALLLLDVGEDDVAEVLAGSVEKDAELLRVGWKLLDGTKLLDGKDLIVDVENETTDDVGIGAAGAGLENTSDARLEAAGGGAEDAGGGGGGGGLLEDAGSAGGVAEAGFGAALLGAGAGVVAVTTIDELDTGTKLKRPDIMAISS